MADLSDPLYLEQVLEALGANNTEIIRQAEGVLRPFLKSPGCLAPLLQQIEHSTKVYVRHVGALILKRKINNLYSQCDLNGRQHIKSTLLRLMTSEVVNVVRTAIAGVAATLAKVVFSTDDSWEEIFGILVQLLESPDEHMRSLSFNLLGQLSEHIPSQLLPHTATIATMILSGCGDPSHIVAVSSLKAATIYIGSICDEDEVMGLQGVLSQLLEVMQKCLVNGDEDVLSEGLEMIQECAAMERPLVNDHISSIVPFAISIMGNTSLESSTRNIAGQTILSIIELRPKLLAKQNLVEPALRVFVQAIASTNSSGAGSLFSSTDRYMPNGEDDDDDEDYQPEMEVTELAQMCLDRMSLSISSKSFVGPALAVCAEFMDSPDMNTRKAGCATLGIITEGCADTIREMLPDILPRVLYAVKDQEYYVRESACFALGQFSEHCQPEILFHHQTILPVVFEALSDPRPTVQGTSCYVLENFCENLLPQTLTPLLPQLMERLGHLLHTSRGTTQEMSLAAIAATAVAAEDNFLPYAAATVQVLSEILFVSEPQLLNIRGRALECLGHIAVAIGQEQFTPYFELGLRSALQGVQMEDEGLKEYAYTYIANCAKVMKNAFDPHLPSLVPHLLEVVAEPELSPFTEDPDALDGLADEEDAAEDNDQYHLTVEEGFVNNKKAAICALGSLADHTGASYFPYLETTLNTLLQEQNGALWSFHRLIRAEALLSLQYFLKSACLTHGPVTPPAKAEVLALSSVVLEVVKVVMTTYINALDDVERLPTAYALEGLEASLKLVGMAALTIMDESGKSYGDIIMASIVTLLKEKGKCQTVLKHEGEDEDDDHDNLVMDAVCDLIPTLAKVIGADFIRFFDFFVKHIVKFTKKNRPHSDRAMAIGCFAEVIKEIGPAAGMKYADSLLPILKEGLADTMEGVRRNSSYCVGVLCEIVPEKMTPISLQVLQWLYPLCVRSSAEVVSDVGGADKDNAVAAVARMIMHCEGAVPLPQVLPVMLAALPLRSDYGEALSVYRCLSGLVSNGDPTALGLLPQLLSAFAEAIQADSRYDDETKVIVITCIKHLASSRHDMLVSLLGQIQADSPHVVEIIHHAIQS